jgi:hypothetical protein
MKKNISILLVAVLAMVTSCKKDRLPNTPNKNDEVKNSTDTLKMIQGLWKGNLSYYTMELKSDFSFTQDWTNAGMGYYRAKYKLRNDSLIVVDGSNNAAWFGSAKILKLTQDSLVIKAYGFTYRHIRYNVPVSPYGVVTIAGNGIENISYSPYNNVPAIKSLLTINSVTEDGNGSVYVPDLSIGVIYRIDPADKKIYAFLTDELMKPYEPYFAPSCLFIYPGSDDLYFLANNVDIYKCSLKTKKITLLYSQKIGSGNQINISGIAVDKAGDLYVIDSITNIIYKIDATTKALTALTGKFTTDINLQPGTGTNVHLYPKQIVIDDANNMYIADARTSCVWKLDLNTNKIKIVAGNGWFGYSGDGGPATNASLKAVTGVGVDRKGCIYISDWANTRVRKVDENGIISTIAGRLYGMLEDSDDANTSTIAPDQLYVNQSGTEVLVSGGKRLWKLYLR